MDKLNLIVLIISFIATAYAVYDNRKKKLPFRQLFLLILLWIVIVILYLN